MNITQFGYGRWGQNHARILRALGHTVSTIDVPNNPTRVLAETPVDAVIITASSVAHFPLIMEAHSCGIPTFCEKPICLTTDQRLQLQGIAKLDPQWIFMAGHQLLFDPEIQGSARSHSPWYMASQRTGAVPRDEGAILSLAVHDIALAHFLFDTETLNVEFVEGNRHNARIVLENRGSTAEILVQSFANIRLRHLTIIGRRGSKFLSPDNWGRYDLLKLELKAFLYCCTAKCQPAINNLEAACNVMKTTLEVQERFDI